ncbi:hypothetical protein [Sinorhizobium sp. CCBAU 05631]|uniref:hypothetical protein n=1 Tax=Sinorhizobium sp. CCBAU 05631 TaxID=794846 RepID=UPI000559F2B3|nr:hypothetical protein [Sinorhizobium sp. CCBAU 05631]
MKHKMLYAAAFALVSCPAVAQDVKFDVFGIQVGATPAVVSQALTDKGFSIYQELRGPSFDEQIALRRNKIEMGAAKGAVKEIMYVRDEDRVSVTFAAWPEGEKVVRVTYHPSITEDDCPTFESAAQKKYGHGIEYAGTWIDRPLVKNGLTSRGERRRNSPGQVRTRKQIRLDGSAWGIRYPGRDAR